jgi:hypothetical protein
MVCCSACGLLPAQSLCSARTSHALVTVRPAPHSPTFPLLLLLLAACCLQALMALAAARPSLKVCLDGACQRSLPT